MTEPNAMPRGFAATRTAAMEVRIDIHTRKLRYFLAVAEDLHFTHAATRLLLTQQALSRQIRDLEQLIGAQLFERTTRRVALTPAGEAFYRSLTGVVSAFDDAVAVAGSELRSH